MEKFDKLLKDGIPLETKNMHGLTPLQIACTKQDVEMVTKLLSTGVHLNGKSSRKELRNLVRFKKSKQRSE